MRFLTTILFLFFVLLGFSQSEPPQSAQPIEGYPYFLLDAQGRVIGSDDGSGALSIVGGIDTTSAILNQPPDTAQLFTVNVGGVDEPFTSLKTEIRSYWTLEEAAGNAIDSVGTADLPIVGTVTRQQAGVIDDCYQFATDGKLGPIDTDFEFTGSFTVGCWVKTTASGAYQGLITNNSPTANRGWDLMTTSGGMKAWFAIRGDWGTAQLISTDVIEDGVWHYLAGSYNSVDDTIKVWIDGVVDKSDEAAAGPVYSTDCRFNVGSRYAGNFLTGYIDEPATWNRELTPEEMISLYNAGSGYQYPFTGEAGGGDSLNMVIEGEDTRADTMYVLWKYDGWSTDTTDGNLLFRIPIDDMEAYRDTTFLSPVRGDSLAYFTALTKWGTSVTPKGNQDTVFVDSSALTPPDQDLPGFDIIFEQGFEDHTGLPKEYTNAIWVADNWNTLATAENPANYRNADNRRPGTWVGEQQDSIRVDAITGSNVIELNFTGDTVEGTYTCRGNGGGDAWKTNIGYQTETYVSYNVLIKAGWLWSSGGKLGVGQSGGIDFPHSSGPTRPNSSEGFTNEIMWDWRTDGLEWYLYWQDMTGTYGTPLVWNDFQPSGYGIPYNPSGGVTLETDTWYNITTRTVLNTFTGPSTANHDGILEAFVNGALVERVSGLQLLPYSNKDIGLDWIFFAMFFGGGGPALREEKCYIDDIVVFTYDVTVEGIPRGNVPSDPGRVISLPPGVWPKEVE